LKSLEALKTQQSKLGPQTDDQLHQWIKDNLGLNIPRVAVCDDHQSPFDFISDIYFERVDSAIAVASRDGGKTMASALIHLLNSLFKPGCESITVGAIWAQSNRAYENLKKLAVRHGKVPSIDKHPMIPRTTQEKTVFENGSTVEILPGTIAAVNGPHGQKLHRDEAELMDTEVFKEANNISSSKLILDENGNEKRIKAQDWITSTRKWAHGPMQNLVEEIEKSIRNGFKPTYKLYTWCVFEVAERQDNCQVAYPNLPASEKCDCHNVVKGEWDDESPRRFTEVCRGRLARSDGYTTITDIHKKFLENDRDTWEAQKECSKPEVGGLIFPMFTKQRYGIKFYEPNPMYGDIYMSVDYGGTNPHAVNWYQVLDHDMDVYGHDQDGKEEPIKRLKAGTVVCFDEIYRAEIGNVELADMVIQKEKGWQQKYPNFKIKRRFADVAAKAARKDWEKHKPPLYTVYYVTREVEEHIKTCKDLLNNDLFAVCTDTCENFCNEIESWPWQKKKPNTIDEPVKPVDDFNHCMSNFRYAMENIKYIARRTPSNKKPKFGQKKHIMKNVAKSSAPRYLPRG
jgi:hypothetical protein